jgi:hypothetical protein
MKAFESHLKNNQAKLKKEVLPSDRLWTNIQQGLQKKRQQHKRKIFFRIAASLVIAVSVSLAVFTQNTQELDLPLLAYSAEYGQVEKALKEDIQYKKGQIENIEDVDGLEDILQSFWLGMENLDIAYQNYQKMVDNDGCTEMVMQLIVENYSMKSDLLESLFDELTKVKSYEKFN